MKQDDPPLSRLAVVSAFCGGLSVLLSFCIVLPVFFWCLVSPVPILGILCGAGALRAMSSEPQIRGRRLALWGLGASLLTLLLFCGCFCFGLLQQLGAT